MVEPLLRLAADALGRALAGGLADASDLALLPEELAVEAWNSWIAALRDTVLAAHMPPPPPPPLLQRVLAGFGVAFWQPAVLRLAYPPAPALPPGLTALPLVAARLQHLELRAPGLTTLAPLAAGCPALRCLSLRGCAALLDGALAALPSITTLEAVDLGGLAGLSDTAVFHVAKLPRLSALNLSQTSVGDACLQFLTYGHSVAAWAAAASVERLPPEAAAWPPLLLEHLQLAGTRVTPAGAGELERLPRLRFLDARHTGLSRAVLGPLQRRFALQAVQAAVLTDSNSAAAAVVTRDAVLCRCGAAAGGGDAGAPALSDLKAWQAGGVAPLLQWDPATGAGGLLLLVDGGSGGAAEEKATVPPGYRRRRSSDGAATAGRVWQRGGAALPGSRKRPLQ